MINKYSGITIILLAIASLFGSWMMYKNSTKNFYVSSRGALDSQQLIRNIQIKPEAFESLKIMNDVVSKLSQSRLSSDNSVSIALSPYENKEKRPLIETPSAKEKNRLMAIRICRQARKLNVSMSFVSEDNKYAVISGKFVREGQFVKGKFKVLSITENTIKLQKQGVKCKIKIQNNGLTKN